ncbi:hypothetical protein [Nonomuraea angiospora]|uniref:hypothetical protein n=1 Tax=Nonomuraea angiospora TaxID=46172 RepID=UPI0029B9DE81|nr:hypothetical protein [Nonomuraea angiospora]MDX3109773.1 hypothetical protein [Nonomuraea angiospora]
MSIVAPGPAGTVLAEVADLVVADEPAGVRVFQHDEEVDADRGLRLSRMTFSGVRWDYVLADRSAMGTYGSG